MTKQEQIEEMCEAIASMICEIYNPECDEYKPHTCSHCYANSTLIGDFAEMLIDAGYRKADEVRKETAKEILNMLYDMGIDKEILECCGIYDVNGVSLVKQICEKYDVEVEER